MLRVCILRTIVKIKEYSVKATHSNKMQRLYEMPRLSFRRYNCSFKKRTSELMHGCQPIPGATQDQGGGCSISNHINKFLGNFLDILDERRLD